MADRLNSVAARDKAHHLHPYTNLKAFEETGPKVIVRGKGVRVFDETGKAYIEGLSGLWCTALGWGEERLIDAATQAMRNLSFYHSFGGKVPEVTAELATKLIEIAPTPMGRVIFANSGSESNDTAIKLIWYYNNALGRPEKKKLISRVKGYHGVTVATASLTALPNNQRSFDLPIDRVLHTTCPHHYRFAKPDETELDFSARCARELEDLIVREGPDTVAAFFAEPVMGAGGVIVPPEGYFDAIQPVLRKYDVLLVADEVICGFGRTGNLWGSQTFNIQPDLLTCAKALSSAYLPISALMVSQKVYEAVRDESARIGVFGHGYTYGGHPVSAAVALEAIKIYEERDIVAGVRERSPHLQDGLKALQDHPLVGEVRGIGLIAGIEIVRNKETKEPYPPTSGVQAYLWGRLEEHGLITRVIGDTIAICPPLVIDPDTIAEIVEIISRSLDEALEWASAHDLAPQ